MDKEFLIRLKQKLQIGNTRSIHLNSQPGRLLTRLDASELNYLQNGLIDNFITLLLKEQKFNFKFNISPDNLPNIGRSKKTNENEEDSIKKRIGIISRRLTSILYENEDNFLEHGIKTFGFGFPILAYRPKSDTSKTIYAPIIIWKLDISRCKNEWVFYRDEDYSITLNEVLLNYLENDRGTSGLSRLSDEDLEDSIIDKSELYEICNDLLNEIGKEDLNFEVLENLQPLDNKEVIKQKFTTLGNPYISYSGVFGLYRSQKEAVIKDISELINNQKNFKFDKLKVDKYQTTTFTPIETDPAQSKVLTDLSNKTKLIIHGPPGTGKSQSLTAIISNALVNNVKCLVVCEKKTALEVIRKNLEIKGLGELCGLIEDVNRDRKALMYSVRERTFDGDTFDFNILENIILETKSKITNVNNGHRIYGKPLLNHLNWTSLVGRYMKLRKNTDLTETLYTKIESDSYNFKSDSISVDFNSANDLIKELNYLYKTVSHSIDSFCKINDNFLLSSSQIENSIKIKSYLQKLDDIISKFIAHIEDVLKMYKQDLLKFYEDYKLRVYETHRAISELYRNNRHNKIFLKESSIGEKILKLQSLFIKSKKQILNDKTNILNLFHQLQKLSHYNLFVCNLEDTNNPSVVIKNADLFIQMMEKWYSQSTEQSNKLCEELSKDTNYDYIKFNFENVTKVIKSYSFLINNINESKVFNENFTVNTTNLYQIIVQLKSLKGIVNTPLSKMSDFSDYYSYREFFLKLDNNLQYIINKLIETKSPNWQLDYETWFIFNLLVNYDPHITLKNENGLKTIKDNFYKISNYQISQILSSWRSKQYNSSINYQNKHGHNKSALYNLNKNKQFGKQNSLRKIINTDFKLFTDYFPVVLLNPIVCSSLFKMEEGLFDLVIFDEASQLRVEDVYAAKLRGKHRIVAGDENQMPPSNYFTTTLSLDPHNDENEDNDFDEFNASSSIADSESLLEYAKRKGYDETYLEVHYRSKHPDLIEFSNAAFYGSRLKPMPSRNQYTAIKFYNLNGIYNQEEGVNELEADKVLEIIDKEVDLKNSKFPSIGIATLNLTQRNLILNKINEKCELNSDFATKIYKLKDIKGEQLFVKNLENIQGDERDIIIISTTFGKRTDNKFIQNYGPINQQKGFRLLNVIITRAKQRLYVCTSIPDKYISEYSQLLSINPNNGRAIFYSYLAYAKAISDNDIEKRDSILKLLREKSDVTYKHPDDIFTESVFEQEVLDILSNNFDPKRIKLQYSLGGFRIDIVILSKGFDKPIIAIECDGASYHSSSEAYAWDIFRQKILEEYGLKFIRIWSTNWFNNPEKELAKLLSFINKYDIKE